MRNRRDPLRIARAHRPQARDRRLAEAALKAELEELRVAFGELKGAFRELKSSFRWWS